MPRVVWRPKQSLRKEATLRVAMKESAAGDDDSSNIQGWVDAAHKLEMDGEDHSHPKQHSHPKLDTILEPVAAFVDGAVSTVVECEHELERRLENRVELRVAVLLLSLIHI